MQIPGRKQPGDVNATARFRHKLGERAGENPNSKTVEMVRRAPHATQTQERRLSPKAESSLIRHGTNEDRRPGSANDSELGTEERDTTYMRGTDSSPPVAAE